MDKYIVPMSIQFLETEILIYVILKNIIFEVLDLPCYYRVLNTSCYKILHIMYSLGTALVNRVSHVYWKPSPSFPNWNIYINAKDKKKVKLELSDQSYFT